MHQCHQPHYSTVGLWTTFNCHHLLQETWHASLSFITHGPGTDLARSGDIKLPNWRSLFIVNHSNSSFCTYDAVKLHRVTLDSALMFDKNITNITHCCYYHTRPLRHIRLSLTLDTAKNIAASIVGSRLDYCNSVLYGVSQANIDRLQCVQNVLARVVAQVPSTISSVHIRRDLHWLPVNHHIS